MFNRILILACASVISVGLAAEPANGIVLTEYGVNFARGTLPRKGLWYGLYCKGKECEVRIARVRITSSSAKNVLDEEEALDVLEIDESPIALFHGAPVNQGKVTTWFVPSEMRTTL
jgi:hypothetical protein